MPMPVHGCGGQGALRGLKAELLPAMVEKAQETQAGIKAEENLQHVQQPLMQNIFQG